MAVTFENLDIAGSENLNNNKQNFKTTHLIYKYKKKKDLKKVTLTYNCWKGDPILIQH